MGHDKSSKVTFLDKNRKNVNNEKIIQIVLIISTDDNRPNFLKRFLPATDKNNK